MSHGTVASHVSVENDPATTRRTGIVGIGHGLRGLRELVEEGGGCLASGPTDGGGWSVAAHVAVQ